MVSVYATLAEGCPKEKIILVHQRIDGDPTDDRGAAPPELAWDWPITERYVRLFAGHLGLPLYWQWRALKLETFPGIVWNWPAGWFPTAAFQGNAGGVSRLSSISPEKGAAVPSHAATSTPGVTPGCARTPATLAGSRSTMRIRGLCIIGTKSAIDGRNGSLGPLKSSKTSLLAADSYPEA